MTKKPSPQPETPQKTADFLYDEPYDLRNNFRNLNNPLKFIESDKIKKLQTSYTAQKNELRKQQEQKADFSKSIYKKVISQDTDYTFQDKVVRKHGSDLVEMYNQRTSKAGGMRENSGFEKGKREDLSRQYKHGEIMSMKQKKERLRQSSQQPLTFAHVKLIDTPEFQNLRDVQFYSLLRGQGQHEDLQGLGQEIQNLNIENHLDNFTHSMIDTSQYQSKQSYNFLFDCDRQLKFWKLGNIFKDERKSDEDVLSTCAFLDPKNISTLQMFDFSARAIEIADIIRFYRLKGQLEAKLDMDRNNQSLEEKYNEAKARFEELKESRLKSKNQRMPAKFINAVAQTNDQMQLKDFEDYFVEDASSIFDKLEQLNAIRDTIVIEEKDQVFSVMATNIGIQISKQLFKLLMLVLKGEKVQNYTQFVRASNEQQVERKILQLIYLQFKNFNTFDVDGTSKAEIIKVYLQQREKNERFYETHNLKRTIQTKKP